MVCKKVNTAPFTFLQTIYDVPFSIYPLKIINGLQEGEWRGILDNSANYVCTYEKGVSKRGVAYDNSGKRYTFTTTDIIEPQFKGGLDKFYEFLGRNIKYPLIAKDNNVQG